MYYRSSSSWPGASVYHGLLGLLLGPLDGLKLLLQLDHPFLVADFSVNPRVQRLVLGVPGGGLAIQLELRAAISFLRASFSPLAQESTALISFFLRSFSLFIEVTKES